MIPLLVILIYPCFEINAAIQDNSNATFPQDSILQQMFGVSRIQCIHRCERDQECKHIAYQKNARTCTLLKDTQAINDGGNLKIKENEVSEKMNEQRSGGFFLKSSPIIFSPHRVLKRECFSKICFEKS